MNKDSRVHSGSKREHQFDEEEKSWTRESIFYVIKKNSPEKAAEIMTDYLIKSINDDKAERESKKRKKRSILIITLIFLGGGILLTCLFELIGRKINFDDMVIKNAQYIPVIVESIPTFISFILQIIKMPETTRRRKDGEGIAEGMLEWGKALWHQLSQASGLHVLLLITLTTLCATLIAQREPLKYIKVFISGGMYSVAQCDDNNNITDSVMMADCGTNKISASYEMKLHLASADEMMIEQLDKAEVTNEQRNMELHLSDEDTYNIFTLYGNVPDGYATQEQLNDMVFAEVQKWCGEKRDNVFDKASEQGGASQKDKDAISRASENEQPEDSFSETESRLDLRESVAKDYPKRTLMQLIANGYQGLALRLVWHEGVKSTIIYYYGQSILFDFECLKFADNTDKLIKERLTITAQRYEDIAYVFPEYERAEEAKKLAIAFRYAADQY